MPVNDINRRTSRSRGLLFYRLLKQALVTRPVTYADVVGYVKKTVKTTKWS